MANVTIYDLMQAYNQYDYYETNKDFWARGMIGRIGVPISSFESSDDYNVFRLLHEIGHCKTRKNGQSKVTREYLATQWAIDISKQYDVTISITEREIWQNYINSFTKAREKYKLDWSPMD